MLHSSVADLESLRVLPISFIVYSSEYARKSKSLIFYLQTSTKYKMKLFVVVISVALVIMFVFATDTAAAPADYEDTNDMHLLTAPAGGIIPQVQVTGSNGHYTKISTKNPLYVIVKTVVKMLIKMFSSDNP